MTGVKDRKPSQPSAFEEKCSRELDKLHAKLAKRLKDDLASLLDSGTEADVTVHYKTGGDIRCHACIIEIRLPLLWSGVLSHTTLRGQIQKVIDREKLMQILRFIYTENDISPVIDQVNELITALQNLKDDDSAKRCSSGNDLSQSTVEGQGHSPSEQTEVSQSRQEIDISVENSDPRSRSPDISNHLGSSYSNLGKDLLRLYHTQTHSNVIVKVKHTVLSLHRCILCARSGYFAAMLGGQWRESAATEINLEGINPVAMVQALSYMYGGLPDLTPDGSHVTELVTIADMYRLDGLKDVICYNFRKDCHFFHKPCTDCISAVLAVLPTAHMFCLEEVYDRALRWCSKHISRVWTSKAFAGLPTEIQDACLHSAMADIDNDSVVAMVMECDKLGGSLTNVRWSEPVVAMATQLMDACIDHLKNNFVAFTNTNKFLQLGKTMALGLGFLGDIFSRAIITMPTNKACLTYARVHELQCLAPQEESWTEDFKQLIGHLEEKCEHFMRLYINQLINTDDWHKVLSHDLQEKIKDGAWYVCVGDGRRLRGPPRCGTFQQLKDNTSTGNHGTNPKNTIARPKNMSAASGLVSKVNRKSKLEPKTINSTKAKNKQTGNQVSPPGVRARPARARQSGLPVPNRKGSQPNPRKKSSSSREQDSDDNLFKTVIQTEEQLERDEPDRSRPPTIKPLVHRSSTCSESPDSRSRMSSTSSTGADNPLSFFLAQNAGHFKRKVETMSNLSYPSNAATANSSLTNPTSDFSETDYSNYTSGSDVFCSPEREIPPPGVAVSILVPPTISEVLPEIEAINFVINSFLVNLKWLFFLPEQ